MNWFQNLKIATKLMGSFAVVAVIAGVIGWMGLSGTKTLAGVADDVYKNQLVSIAELQMANNEFVFARVALRDAFLTEVNKRQEFQRISIEHMRRSEDHIAKYKQTGLSEEEKKVIPEFER